MELNTFKRKIKPFRKLEKSALPKTCKVCNEPKEEKEMRGRICKKCDNEKKNAQQRQKRAEKWDYLGLDMSTKF